MTRYEIFNKNVVTDAQKGNYSPNAYKCFASKDEAKEYVRKYYENTSGRIEDLVICEVKYTPIFEITHTVSFQEKDL